MEDKQYFQINSEENLETKIEANKSPSAKKVAIVDTAGNVTCSLILGGILDYCAGLNLTGIVASRASATAINTVTGGPYGWWREKTFKVTKTTENSRRVRKTLADLLAFNTFQVPVYAAAVAIGSFASEGKVDFDKVAHGATYLAAVSPFIGPILGLFMDGFRKVFGVKSAAEGAYVKSEPTPKKDLYELK